MLVPYGTQETIEQREKRLLSNRIKKARVLNTRIKVFMKDVCDSKYTLSQKQEILREIHLGQFNTIKNLYFKSNA